jgi:hypothetical protein
MDVTTTNVLTQDPGPPEFIKAVPLAPIDGTEQRLLDFVGQLILDVARTHPRVRDLDVALWIARVAVGAKE